MQKEMNAFKLVATVLLSAALMICVVCMFCGCNTISDSGTETTDAESECRSDTFQYYAENISETKTVTEKSTTENESIINTTGTELTYSGSIDTNITDNDALIILEQISSVAYEYNLSVSYKYNQYHYSINGSKAYDSASTIKVIYCQYLLASGTDFDEEIVFETNYDRTSSTGKLTAEHKGEVFTVGELIEYSVVYSDNMAYRLLFDKYGYEDYNEYVKKLGAPGLAFDSDREFTKVTAQELTAGMWEILQFSTNDNRLVAFLIDAEYKHQIASGTDYTVASKYGYQGGTNGFHDTAIVFAPEPYVLTVMSNLDPGENANATKPFGQIAELTDALYEILCKL